jgi:hypothetical protein
MKTDSAARAVQVANSFIDAFNKQDYVALADTLNFPHIRLANDRFLTMESAEQFIAGGGQAEDYLRAEGWAQTRVTSIEVIHSGETKVHLALAIQRQAEGGQVYNHFDTLWIVTLLDDHWGIQFRSSFLRKRAS